MKSAIPWPRILAEGVAIVASILLAFGIQAWWEGRQERAEEHRVLMALLQESRTNSDWLERMIPYHEAQTEAVAALLDAAAEEVPSISPDSIDHLLIQLSAWFSPPYEQGALEATLSGGKLDLIEDEGLRSQIAGWQITLESARVRVADEVHVYEDVWMPFLRENASVPQISNAQVEIAPGLNLGDRYASLTPVIAEMNHTALLRIPQFVNILQEKKWVHEDALNVYADVRRSLDELVQALEGETGPRIEAR